MQIIMWKLDSLPLISLLGFFCCFFLPKKFTVITVPAHAKIFCLLNEICFSLHNRAASFLQGAMQICFDLDKFSYTCYLKGRKLNMKHKKTHVYVDLLIDVRKRKVKHQDWKVREWQIEMCYDKKRSNDSAVKALVNLTVDSFYETRRKTWVGGSLEKDIQETVDFLVCQKQVVLFHSFLSLLSPYIYITCHHIPWRPHMQHFYLAQQFFLFCSHEFLNAMKQWSKPSSRYFWWFQFSLLFTSQEHRKHSLQSLISWWAFPPSIISILFPNKEKSASVVQR